MSRPTVATIGLFVCLILFALLPRAAVAQDGLARTVVLEVRGGGTERLEAALAELPGLEIRRQPWFVDQVKKSGVSASRLMSRPNDLKFVMSSAAIRYIIAVQPDDEVWKVSVFGEDGAVSREFGVERGGEELSLEEAGEVREGFGEFIGAASPNPPAEDTADAESTAQTTTTVSNENAESPEPSGEGTPATKGERPGFELGISATALRRDVTYAGANGAQFSFRSVLYPGARLRAALFPTGLSSNAGDVGFAVDGLVGRDTLSTEEGALGILHIEGELALLLRTAGALSFELGAGHMRFDLPENGTLPSTSSTFTRIGVRFDAAYGALGVQGRVGAIPFGIATGGGALFGESSLMFGFDGQLGLLYRVSKAFAFQIGNTFRVLRTSFRGQGTLDFRDTRAFELVWGPNVGITLAF